MGVYITVGCFILFDIVTGLLKAIYKGNINSTYLRKGLFHKLAEVFTVIGCGLFEYGIQYVNLGVEIPVLKVVSAYICIMEMISILENLANVNPGLGKLFKPYLEKLKNNEEEK